SGSIAAVGLRVPADALDWWQRRFDDAMLSHGGIEERNGRQTVAFADPEGQRLVLVADGESAGCSPWSRSTVPAERQIRGLSHVLLDVDRLAPTEFVLTRVMGFRRSAEYAA